MAKTNLAKTNLAETSPRESSHMKFTLERAALLKSLGHVQSVVERRNTIPILANVLIRAAGQDVSFAATDMEIEINDTVAGQASKSGAITAPAHTLYEIVRK